MNILEAAVKNYPNHFGGFSPTSFSKGGGFKDNNSSKNILQKAN